MSENVNDSIDVMVFVRLRDDEHCQSVIHRLKTHEVVWDNTNSALMIISQMLYECYRQFLINHPQLSCYTEIQKIIPKMNNPTKVTFGSKTGIVEREFNSQTNTHTFLLPKEWLSANTLTQ